MRVGRLYCLTTTSKYMDQENSPCGNLAGQFPHPPFKSSLYPDLREAKGKYQQIHEMLAIFQNTVVPSTPSPNSICRDSDMEIYSFQSATEYEKLTY